MTANPYDTASNSAALYSDVRPAYPQGVLDVLIGELRRELCTDEPAAAHIASHDTNSPAYAVLDVGAGTGKFTAQLLERGLDTWALEPASGMRAEFQRALPNFDAGHLLSGSAENIPVESETFSAVTFAQSWHWLDTHAAAAEAARVLIPQGVCAVVVNQLAVEIPWVHRLTRIMRSGDIYKPGDFPQLGEHFTPPRLWTTDWEDELTIGQICELGQTRASWIRAGEGQREKMRTNLLWYLCEHLGYASNERVRLPYHTYMWYSRKRQ